MAIKQIVPIFINLVGDGSSTTFSFALQNIYQQGFGGSVPFGSAGVVPSSIAVTSVTPSIAITSAVVDANGNITITFTSAPATGTTYQLEVDVAYNSGAATSSSPTQTTNVTVVGSSSVTISGTASQNIAQVNGVALGSPSNYGTSPGAVSVMGVNAFVTNTVTVSGTITANAGTGTFNTSDGNAIAIASTTSGQKGFLEFGAVTTNAPSYTTAQSNALSLDTSGNLRVSLKDTPANTNNLNVAIAASSATVTVTGTVTANAGSGTFTTSDTNLVAQASTTSGQKGPLIQGAVTTNAPAYTTAQTDPLSLDTSGNLRVSLKDTPANTNNLNVNVAASAATLPTNLTQLNGVALGSPSTFGSNPGAVNSLNTNAYVINTVGISGNVGINSASNLDRTGTGSITSNQSISVGCASASMASIQVTGTWTGTLVFEYSVDGGITFVTLPVYPISGASVTSTTANGNWFVPVGGFNQIRVRGNTVTSGTASIALESGTGSWFSQIVQPTASLLNATVTGTVAATQSGTWTVQPGNTANTTPWLTTINQGGNSATVTASNALKVDGSAVTQPVSGTITANAGTGTFNVASANLELSQASTTSGQKGPLIQGAVTTNAPAYTTAQTDPLSLDTSGNLRVSLKDTPSNTNNLNVNIAASGATVTVSDTNFVSQGSTTSGEKGLLNLGAVTTSAPTYTTGQTSPLSLDTSGNLRVTGSFSTGALADLTTAISLTTVGNTAQIALAGRSSASFILTSVGTGGQVVAEGSVDGTNWFAIDVWSEALEAWVSSTITTTGSWWFEPVGALNAVRVRCTAITSGTITGTLLADSVVMGTFEFQGSTGQAVPTNTVYIGGTDGTNLRGILTGTDGRIANNLSQVGGNTVSTAASGVLKVGVVGNAGNAFDASASQNQTAPANMLLVGGEFNTTPATITSGNVSPLQLDSSGNLKVNDSIPMADLVGSTAALNALNATASINAFGYNSVGMFLAAGTLIGTIVPEASLDGGTTWVSTFFDDPATSNKVSSIVFSSSNTATTRTIVGVAGASNYRVRVSAFTSGTANCTVRANQIADPSTLHAGAAGGTLPPTISQIGGSVTTAAPTYTTGTLNAASLTTGGALRIDQASHAGTALGAPSNFGTSPGAVSVQGVNASLFAGTTALVAPTWGTATTGTGINVNASLAAGTTMLTAATFGTTTSGTGILVNADLYAGTTKLSATGNALQIALAPQTTGGASIATGSIGATVTSVKASAGQVYGWYFYNSNSTVAYVQFFNLATGSVTLGTTAPTMSIGIPAGAAANVFLATGLAFGTAITIAITTTRGGSTGPASTVDYNIWFA